MPCLQLSSAVDLDVVFMGEGLHVGIYQGENSPSQLLSWDELESEMVQFCIEPFMKRPQWEEGMAIANQLIKLGVKLRRELYGVEHLLPDQFEQQQG